MYVTYFISPLIPGLSQIEDDVHSFFATRFPFFDIETFPEKKIWIVSHKDLPPIKFGMFSGESFPNKKNVSWKYPKNILVFEHLEGCRFSQWVLREFKTFIANKYGANAYNKDKGEFLYIGLPYNTFFEYILNELFPGDEYSANFMIDDLEKMHPHLCHYFRVQTKKRK